MDPFEQEADPIEHAYANGHISDQERQGELRELGRAEAATDEMNWRLGDVARERLH